MNRIFKYIESAGIATALVVALLYSCSDNEISHTKTEVSISYPADAEGLTIVSEEIKAVNLSTGQTQILPWRQLTAGLPVLFPPPRSGTPPACAS